MESCFNPSLNCSRRWVRGKQLFNSTQQQWIKKRTSPGKVTQGIYHTPCVCLNCALPLKVKCQFLQRRGGFFSPALLPRFISEVPGSTMPSTESLAILKHRGRHNLPRTQEAEDIKPHSHKLHLTVLECCASWCLKWREGKVPLIPCLLPSPLPISKSTPVKGHPEMKYI